MGFFSFHLRHKTYMSSVHVYVVVQFHPWFIFYLPLFWGMVMHDNKFEIKFKPRIRIEPKHIYTPRSRTAGNSGGHSALAY